MHVRHVRIAAPIVFVAALALSGCALIPGEATPERSTTPTAMVESPSPSGGVSPGEFGDAIAERDQFFIDQQAVPGKDELVARTDAQKALIAGQREYFESRGGTWSPELETVTLALAMDACETSILNAHRVDANVFTSHIATSPLFAQFAGTDPDAQAGLASIMIYGTGFICPDDAPQWQAAASDAGF
jgi:hypothetical protein